MILYLSGHYSTTVATHLHSRQEIELTNTNAVILIGIESVWLTFAQIPACGVIGVLVCLRVEFSSLHLYIF